MRSFLIFVLIVALVSSPAYTITVSMERSGYLRGAQVKVSGRLTEAGSPITGVYVGCQVTKPDSSTLWADQLLTNGTGHFSGSFTLPSDAPYGTYTVYATYSGGQATTTFSVAAGLPEFPTEIIQMITAITLASIILMIEKRAGWKGSRLKKLFW